MTVSQFQTFRQAGAKPELQGGSVDLSKLGSWQIPETDDAFWHTQYQREPYYVAGRGFGQYRPAYLLGSYAATYQIALHQKFESLEDELRQQWLQAHGSSLLSWEQVRDAVAASWQRTLTESAPAEPLSHSEQNQLKVLLDSGHRFVDQANDYVERAGASMLVDALRRFACEAADLLAQLETTVRAGITKEQLVAPTPIRWMQALRHLWQRTTRAVGSVSLDQVLQYLRDWLESAEALAKQPLPSRVAKVLCHQVLVLRAQSSFYAGTHRMQLSN